ncbi:MAG: ATP-dependent DNA helicase RecG [Caldisericia bacterium]
MFGLDTTLKTLSKNYKMLNKLSGLGIITVNDLLHYFPFRHADRTIIEAIRDIMSGQNAVVLGRVYKTETPKTKGGIECFQASVTDADMPEDHRTINLIWFRQPFLEKMIKPGMTVLATGKCAFMGRHKSLFVSEYEILEKDKETLSAGRIVPFYPLTKGITQKSLRAMAYDVIKNAEPVSDYLTAEEQRELEILSLDVAIKNYHWPSNMEMMLQSRQRLAFDECYKIQSRFTAIKQQTSAVSRPAHILKKTILTPFREKLPFEFTDAQCRVIQEIFKDMMSPNPMNRMLMGEVGSGKTIVALCAMLLAVENKRQAVLMAPTGILAEQHYKSIQKLLSKFKIPIALIKGGAGEFVKDQIKNGVISIIIGTHALLEESVDFSNVGLVVVDELQKFGVEQRKTLHDKAGHCDLLTMSATPIPRSIALTLYGDLDFSVIDEMPAGRKQTITQHIDEVEAYNFIDIQLRKGEQAFVVYPLVNERVQDVKDTDANDDLFAAKPEPLKAAVEWQKHLQARFPHSVVGLLHGQMTAAEKETVMQDFIAKKIHVLVTTIIVEVGVDTDVNIMAIEHPERYGLSTLHQLRGRVGRTGKQGYCILVKSANETEDGLRRIEALLSTTDGFKIAEADMGIRGIGELVGDIQSGELHTEFRIAKLPDDIPIMVKAKQFSQKKIIGGIGE